MSKGSLKTQEFRQYASKPYKEQAMAVLNAFYNELSGNPTALEDVWKFCHMFIDIDHEKKAEGTGIDEFQAHRLLEKLNETKRVVELREAIKEADVEVNLKKLSLIEFLIWRNKASSKTSISEFLRRKPPLDPPTKSNPALMKAQADLDKVQAEINRIENRKSQLEEASAGGGVKANTAKNELSQLLTADNTDLNRALISAEASVRKAQKEGGGGVVPPGVLWWLNRELEEMKKYRPQRKK
eukprot:TRINITY_DN26782_c0_g1_i1.p1 TRINITY_DN26782_c0_g1~~TRINITY_DN26782_c0_g1_i1.p1  ORF type:complete len:241 (+),score=67.98 TRINITY_DN26782_c0_g1_i1:31-753(+)